MDRLSSNLLLAIDCSWRPLVLLLLRRSAACRPLGRPALLQERVGSAAHNLLQEGRCQHNHRSLLLLRRRQHWQGYMGRLLPNRRLHVGQQPSCQLHAVLIAVHAHSGGGRCLSTATPLSVPPAA